MLIRRHGATAKCYGEKAGQGGENKSQKKELSEKDTEFAHRDGREQVGKAPPQQGIRCKGQ